jgi:L-alanine-DL-glutamate epimerase-like enolase superfamily enzyme
MSKIERIHFATVVRPMKTIFATSLGAKTCATSVIVKVALTDGHIGIGEVPTSFVLPHETVKAIKSVLTQARRQLVGCPISEYESLVREFRNQQPKFHMSVSGLEAALFRAWLASQSKSEFQYWGAKFKMLETDITIPFVPQARVLDNWLAEAMKTGFRIYKIKVSGDVDIDVKFVENIHNRLSRSSENFVIRLDGNQGFTAASCLKMLDKLEKKKMSAELFEQPLVRNDYAGFKNLYSRSPVPIIADETVFSPGDCKRVIEERLAHGVNIKLAKSGIAASRQILQMAKKAELKVMIGCMTETMVGLSAAICFAAGTNAFDYVDLDSIHFLHHKNYYNGLTVEGRHYHIK